MSTNNNVEDFFDLYFHSGDIQVNERDALSQEMAKVFAQQYHDYMMKNAVEINSDVVSDMYRQMEVEAAMEGKRRRSSSKMSRPEFYTAFDLVMLGVDTPIEEVAEKVAELQAYIEYQETLKNKL
jgi:methanogenic corrinoid protein MtbC1